MKKSNVTVTSSAIAATMQDVATGRFHDGYLAVVWKQGRYIHAKLFDDSGNEKGSQYGIYGPSKCRFFTDWTFIVGGVNYVFTVWGATKIVKNG